MKFYNMNKSENVFAKWNKPYPKGYIMSYMIHLYEAPRADKFIETRKFRVPGLDDEKALEMDSDDGCTILQMYLMPLHRTLNS